jgi:hypothetical protein
MPFSDPFADSGAYDKCDSTLAFGRTVGALTRDMWLSYGLGAGASALSRTGGTASIAVGSGRPFHVAYGAASRGGPTQWVHAAGSRLGNLRVTSSGAENFASTQARATLTGIPVINASNVTSTGGRAATCVGAAAAGVARGMIP